MHEMESGRRKMKKEGGEIYLPLLSSLPALYLLEKLMEKRQQGKHPFKTFNFEAEFSKVKKAEETINSSLSDDLDIEACLSAFDDLIQVTEEAEQEIQMASLKEDYHWIKDTFVESKKQLTSFF